MTVLADTPNVSLSQELTERRNLVYVLSPSYSGSTLLTMLLATHPDVATIGELKAQAMGDVDKYVCSCGEKIRTCPFWGAVTEALRARGHGFDLADFGTHFRAPGDWLADRLLRASYRGFAFETVRDAGLKAVSGSRRTMKHVLERNRVMIQVILELQGGRIFLDGSKDVIRLKHLLDSGMWNVKVIYLVRDGRGAAGSYMRHHEVNMRTAAGEWVHAQREARRLLNRLPRESWLAVRYEDLCRQPTEVVGDLLGFMDCSRPDGPPLPVDGTHHILGNNMRLRPLDAIRLDKKWRHQLTPSDFRVFDKIAGKVNGQLEYE